jgi:nucleoid DNA-binding protein
MAKKTHIEGLIEKLSEKYGISKIKTEQIINSQFHKWKEVVTEDDFKSLQIIHLGKIQVSEKRLNNYIKNKENDRTKT